LGERDLRRLGKNRGPSLRGKKKNRKVLPTKKKRKKTQNSIWGGISLKSNLKKARLRIEGRKI